MGRTLVLGDLHGAHRALIQVLEKSNFVPEEDTIVFLGDVVDGWSESKECIEELLKIPHLVALKGNHDEWFEEWLKGTEARFMPLWTQQGGEATLQSYGYARSKVPPSHVEYIRTAKLWHQDGDRIFVHGGWPWYKFPHPCLGGEPTWDRELWNQALERHRNGRLTPLTQFREVYVGHTSTVRYGLTEPANACEVWNLDQGAGWEGKLSLMDIDNKEFWQSDPVGELYPEAKNARKST